MTPQGLLEYVEPRNLRPHDVVLARVPLSRGEHGASGDKFCVITRISLGDRAGQFTVRLKHWRLQEFNVALHDPILVLVGAEGGRHSWPPEARRPMLVLPRRR